jgi:membrane-bound hydrogenase subunit beta
MTSNRFTPEEIIQSFQTTFSTGVKDSRIEKRTSGVMKTEFFHLWIRIDRGIFKDAVKHLFTFDTYPHFAVASGYDLGETIEMVYHFSLYHGERAKEISLNMTVALPKSNPTIETITDLIPGALISEQEKQEMLGIKVQGIPKDIRVFIADDFPKGIYPWRRDETGPMKLVRNLHEEKK